MDLRTTVAASMLGASRGRVAVLFKELHLESGPDPLPTVLAAIGIAPEGWPVLVAQAFERADRALQDAATRDMTPVPIGDWRYPVLLSCITDPPPVLWTRGCVDLFARPAVAVVGSRAATPYALAVAERLGAELAARGVVVVSGLARGVDSAAHRGCLDAAGATIAVLGSGLDRIYPAEHQELAASLCKNGLLVSEMGPGAAPVPENFPLRNRIISGISLAVVVVEASEKSGSLITARHALEQGRDVMAVPGSVLSGRNRGSHGLLKDGAKVVETADDILEELGWPARPVTVENSAPKTLKEDGLLAGMAPGEAYAFDDLLVQTGLPAPRLLARLTELELHGLIASAGAGRYTRPLRPGGKVRGEVW